MLLSDPVLMLKALSQKTAHDGYQQEAEQDRRHCRALLINPIIALSKNRSALIVD
jgi:hypothetical protein